MGRICSPAPTAAWWFTACGILFSFVTRKNFSFVTRKNFTSSERYLVSLDANTMANKYKSPEVVLVLFVSASSSL